MMAIDLYKMFGVEQVTEIQRRLSEDGAFRAEALADLNGAVSRHYGISLPQTFVVIETAEGFQVLAPVEDDALSEDELDLVAGGTAHRCVNGDLNNQTRKILPG
ncbi:hypothetical protein V6L76_15840 [Pannonibacter sp. Pt2]|uniref:Uncharacterized protein n=1 Tax=Pannonibacter anstelovis TaxID=3121537 RepID=A0ABU7ZRR0_9HYPH